jgi:hypothetical protein
MLNANAHQCTIKHIERDGLNAAEFVSKLNRSAFNIKFQLLYMLLQ